MEVSLEYTHRYDDKHCRFKFGTHVYLSASIPVTVFYCRMAENGVPEQAQVRVVELTTTSGMLPQRLFGDSRRAILAGTDFAPKIDLLAFPPVV